MKKIFIVMLISALVPALSLAGQKDPIDEQFNKCMNNANGITARMIDCENQAYDAWNKRLNSAYQELMSSLDPYSKTLLKNSEIAWLRYVNAWLHFDTHALDYSGTMGQLSSIDEQRSLVKRRAIQLENVLFSLERTGG